MRRKGQKETERDRKRQKGTERDRKGQKERSLSAIVRGFAYVS